MNKKNKLKFYLDKRMPMMYIDFSKEPWWRRLFKKKEYVLWPEDINALEIFLAEYNQAQLT